MNFSVATKRGKNALLRSSRLTSTWPSATVAFFLLCLPPSALGGFKRDFQNLLSPSEAFYFGQTSDTAMTTHSAWMGDHINEPFLFPSFFPPPERSMDGSVLSAAHTQPADVFHPQQLQNLNYPTHLPVALLEKPVVAAEGASHGKTDSFQDKNLRSAYRRWVKEVKRQTLGVNPNLPLQNNPQETLETLLINDVKALIDKKLSRQTGGKVNSLPGSSLQNHVEHWLKPQAAPRSTQERLVFLTLNFLVKYQLVDVKQVLHLVENVGDNGSLLKTLAHHLHNLMAKSPVYEFVDSYELAFKTSSLTKHLHALLSAFTRRQWISVIHEVLCQVLQDLRQREARALPTSSLKEKTPDPLLTAGDLFASEGFLSSLILNPGVKALDVVKMTRSVFSKPISIFPEDTNLGIIRQVCCYRILRYFQEYTIPEGRTHSFNTFLGETTIKELAIFSDMLKVAEFSERHVVRFTEIHTKLHALFVKFQAQRLTLEERQTSVLHAFKQSGFTLDLKELKNKNELYQAIQTFLAHSLEKLKSVPFLEPDLVIVEWFKNPVNHRLVVFIQANELILKRKYSEVVDIYIFTLLKDKDIRSKWVETCLERSGIHMDDQVFQERCQLRAARTFNMDFKERLLEDYRLARLPSKIQVENRAQSLFSSQPVGNGQT